MTPSLPTSRLSFRTSKIGKAIATFYYSNLLVSLAAALLCLQVPILTGASIKLYISPAILLALATFSFYGLHDFFTKVLQPGTESPSNKAIFWKQHLAPLSILFFIAFLSLPWVAFKILSSLQLFLFGMLGVLALTYSFPILPLPGLRRWKDSSRIKIIMLSLVWTLVTTGFVLPPNHEQWWKMIVILLFRFCFMLLICIPFDLRDHENDKVKQGLTLVDRLGQGGLKKLAFQAFTGGWVVLVFSFWLLQWPLLIALALHLSWVFYSVLKALKEPSKAWHYILLDAHMIIQSLLVGATWWFT